MADLNADGSLDLVVADYYDDVVDVLLNRGDGTFAPVVSYQVDNPSFMAVGDVDGDGTPDIVATDYGNDAVSVLLNQGGGSFAPEVVYAAGQNPNDVGLADLDGDGDLDIAATHDFSGTVDVLLNQGNGTFAPPGTYSAYLDGHRPGGIGFGDIDGDGRVDIVLSVPQANAVAILPNAGNGTFGAGVQYPTGPHPTRPAVTDINADGLVDVITLSEQTVNVLLNDGAGGLAPNVEYDAGIAPLWNGWPIASALVVRDLDGDARPDIAAVNRDDSSVSVLLNQGGGAFAPRVTHLTLYEPQQVAGGDLDGDGALDLAVTDGRTIGMLLGRGDGTFVARERYAVASYSYAVAAGDFNNDGMPDLVATNDPDGTVGVFLNQGGGVMGARADFATGQWPREPSVGDMDGDGNLDLVVANYTSASMLFGGGDGTFDPAVDYSLVVPEDNGLFDPNATSSAIADFDGDGELDFALALSFGTGHIAYVKVFLNAGGGTFPEGVDYRVERSGPASLKAGDFDGDGRPDLIMVNSVAVVVTIMPNLGDGTFGAGIPYGVGGFSLGSVAVGDLDNDDRLDFVVSYDGDNAATFINQGDLSFQVVTTMPVAGGCLTLADISGDGLLDIAACGRGVEVLVNLGNGDFGPRQAYATAGWGLVAADFDGDGQVDVANGEATVLLNRCW